MAHVSITSGPSKYDLMRALMDPRSDGTRWVTFSLLAEGSDTKRIVRVTVDMLGPEDGSGESWIIKLDDHNTRIVGGRCSSTRFEGHYRTDTRKGTLKVIAPEGDIG